MMRLESWNHVGEASCSLDSSCSTCGDVAVPVKVIDIDGQTAEVEDRLGTRSTVAIDFVTDVNIGDVLLVHMGVAIGRPQEVK